MKNLIGCVALSFLTFNSNAQLERAYPTNQNTPEWIVLMYNPNANPADVIRGHDNYYKTS